MSIRSISIVIFGLLSLSFGSVPTYELLPGQQLRISDDVTLTVGPGSVPHLRYVLEGLATASECAILQQQILEKSVPGGTYGIAKSTDSEGQRLAQSFAGVEMSQLSREARHVALRVANRVLTAANLLLGENGTILFEFLHLTVRTPLMRNGMHVGGAHYPHSDNCRVQDDGSCIPMPEACCAWRSHSSIVFLNDRDVEFEGGEFYFIDDRMQWSVSTRTHVTPRCGRAVVFSAGAENIHGVEPVRSGKRTVFAAWYTQDLQHDRTSSYVDTWTPPHWSAKWLSMLPYWHWFRDM